MLRNRSENITLNLTTRLIEFYNKLALLAVNFLLHSLFPYIFCILNYYLFKWSMTMKFRKYRSHHSCYHIYFFYKYEEN